jgi:uncharacterized protein
VDKTPELAAKKEGPTRGWRFVRRVIRFVVVSYILVCGAMFLLQTNLIFPGANTQGTREARVVPGEGEELVDLKGADGVAIKGLFGAAQGGRSGGVAEGRTTTGMGREGQAGGNAGVEKGSMAGTTRGAGRVGSEVAGGGKDEGGGIEVVRRPVVIFFYGNAMCMADCGELAALFRDLGYHVMLVDYEGYGLSGGKPSEKGCYAAAEAAYEHVLKRADVDRKKVVVAGWSLGGGVAVDLVYRHRGDGTIAGLMTFCTFSSVADVAQGALPFLPAKLLVRHKFLSAEKMKQLTLPWFGGHGRGDRVIPFKHLARLTAAYAGDAGNRVVFESGADHNDFFDVSPGLKEAVAGFLGRATR